MKEITPEYKEARIRLMERVPHLCNLDRLKEEVRVHQIGTYPITLFEIFYYGDGMQEFIEKLALEVRSYEDPLDDNQRAIMLTCTFLDIFPDFIRKRAMVYSRMVHIIDTPPGDNLYSVCIQDVEEEAELDVGSSEVEIVPENQVSV